MAKNPPITFSDVFALKFAHIKVKNWEEKKKLILANMSDVVREDIPRGEFLETNFHELRKGKDTDPMNVTSILEEELSEFMLQIGGVVQVNMSWIERSTKGMSHSIHNHGALGYSAACYVTYDPNEHTPTQFVSPFNHPITGDIIQYQPLGIKEGDLVLFPSFIHHYTRPSQSDSERIVLSFNLNCYEK